MVRKEMKRGLPSSCPDGDASDSQSICRAPEKSTVAGILEEGHPASNSNPVEMACNRSGSAKFLSSLSMGFCALLHAVLLRLLM